MPEATVGNNFLGNISMAIRKNKTQTKKNTKKCRLLKNVVKWQLSCLIQHPAKRNTLTFIENLVNEKCSLLMIENGSQHCSFYMEKRHK